MNNDHHELFSSFYLSSNEPKHDHNAWKQVFNHSQALSINTATKRCGQRHSNTFSKNIEVWIGLDLKILGQMSTFKMPTLARST